MRWPPIPQNLLFYPHDSGSSPLMFTSLNLGPSLCSPSLCLIRLGQDKDQNLHSVWRQSLFNFSFRTESITIFTRPRLPTPSLVYTDQPSAVPVSVHEIETASKKIRLLSTLGILWITMLFSKNGGWWYLSDDYKKLMMRYLYSIWESWF